MDRTLADIGLLGLTMDLLTSSVSQAAFDPELFTSAFVKSFQLLITASSYVNASWPENSPVKDGDHFDFIVVGCCTAGSVLSNRLTEARHIRLLCIEAGGDPPLTSVIPGAFPLLPLTPYDWHFQSEYDDNTSQGLNAERVVHTRGKMLGGSSSFDHLLIQRGSKLDYDSWAQEGNDGWNYESVLPYFKKAERMLDTKIMNGPTSQYHCDKGPFSVKRPMVNKVFQEKRNIMLKAYEEIGMNTIEDPLVPLPEGTTEGFLHITDNVNRRASAAEEYLLPCKDRPNFYLLKETLVTKIILNDVNEAIGVTVSSKFGKLNVFADLEVIISAGVFNSPKLLMLSGIGPKEELQKFNIPVIQDLPVGKNMQDHVLVPIFLSGNSSISSVLDTPLSVTDLGSLPLPIVSGIFSSSSGDLDMDHITAMFGILSPLLFYFLLTSYNFNLEVCKSVILTEPTREKIVVLASLGKPKSRGEVTLASNDPLIPPKIYNKYLYEGDDVDRMVETIKRILKLLDTPALSGTGGDVIRPPIPTCDHLVYKSDEYWVCYAKVLATTSFRVTSTCSMGHVVDNKFKVKGIKNLRVIDDSVMPIVPTATLCAISVMMAEKGADLIKEQNNITEGVSENYTCN